MFINAVAYILIPLYTIWFVEDSNWFTTNFSVIGNTIGRKEEFVLWGLMVGIYFFWCLRTITGRMKNAWGTWLIPLSMVLLTCALTTPYLPETLPMKAFLHVIFAFMSAVSLMICLICVVWQLYKIRPDIYRRYLAALSIIAVISAVLLVLAGIVSSALEIFFSISTVILVRRLLRQVITLSSGEAP